MHQLRHVPHARDIRCGGHAGYRTHLAMARLSRIWLGLY